MANPNPHDLTISVKIDGQTSVTGDKGNVDLANGKYIQRFMVDQTLGSPDEFMLQFQMGEFKDIILLDKLNPGAEVEIKVGYGTEAVICKAEISRISPHFAAGEMFVVVEGYDKSHRLTRGTNFRHFGDGHKVDQNFGSILGTVVSESKALKGDTSDGLSAQTGSSDSKGEYYAQYAQNDYDFISKTVGNFGLGWGSNSHVDAKTISLKAIETSGAPALKIRRDKFNPDSEAQALSADFLLNTVKQVAKVEVRGWDILKKEAILGKAEAPSSVLGGTAGHEQAGKAHYQSSSSGRVVSIVDVPVTSLAEANEMAQAVFDKLSWDFMTATVTTSGRPELHAGAIVELDDMEFGKRYGGKYLVESCKHVFIAGSGQPYITILGLSRNGSPEP